MAVSRPSRAEATFRSSVYSLSKRCSLRQVIRQQLQIRAGRANAIHMGKLITLIQRGKLDLTPLITHRLPLDKAEVGYRIFAFQIGECDKGAAKPIGRSAMGRCPVQLSASALRGQIFRGNGRVRRCKREHHVVDLMIPVNVR